MPNCFGDRGHSRRIGRTYEDLVSDALGAPIKGWNFSWLTGRADCDDLPWDYASLARDALPNATRLLDIDTGGGEILASLAPLPAAIATEPYPPNVPIATTRLAPLGVDCPGHRQPARDQDDGRRGPSRSRPPGTAPHPAARIGAATPTPGPVGAKHRALARRIDHRIEDYLRFATDPRSPWDNNAAEREIRMAKLRQKVSGGMRTLAGAQHFAALRSYLATTAKHGIDGLEALTRLTTGNPWQPQTS